jgi:hypothetical protein
MVPIGKPPSAFSHIINPFFNFLRNWKERALNYKYYHSL